MKAANQNINYWLNTRKGHYDHKVLFRLKGKAFANYIEQCEKRYQEAQGKALKEEHAEAAQALESLDNEIREYLKGHLFQTVLRYARGDLGKAAQLLKEPTYQKLIDQYEIRTVLYDQYRAEQRRQASQ